jgi:hypothetical protein
MTGRTHSDLEFPVYRRTFNRLVLPNAGHKLKAQSLSSACRLLLNDSLAGWMSLDICHEEFSTIRPRGRRYRHNCISGLQFTDWVVRSAKLKKP